MNTEINDAVCVDVINLGVVDTKFGKKNQIQVVWELDQKNEHGYPITVRKTYNQTLQEKSTLRKDLLSWRGHDLTDGELNGFETDTLKGMAARLETEETLSSNTGNTYLKVMAVHPAGDQPLKPSGKYKRFIPVLVKGERKEAA